MALYGILALCWTMLHYMALYGILWHYMAYGILWNSCATLHSVALYGIMGQYMALYGSIWRMAFY
jgi:hypothetical protein